MKILLSALVVLGVALGVAAVPTLARAAGDPAPVVIAQGRGLSGAKPDVPRSPDRSHRPGELECQNCHVGKHQGMLRMYLGLGGRGTPTIPSHMFQVRVECVACHVAPKEAGAAVGIIGQTFRPTEQACVGCHGEKYRGMLERWAATLAKMREIVAPKLSAGHAALAGADPKNSRHARARKLVEDAEFNIQFVTLGKGVHNVFYAADLLKLSSGWLDEAQGLLGKTPAKIDDTLVRGGYCAALCHEQAGVKQNETVVFAKQKLPHVKHVAEFGAVCTACHSAEVHKAVTATPATCTSCHHSPQNERCESCHRAQSAFYRGQIDATLVKIEPNPMANAVGCIGCHDFSRRHSRKSVGEKCVGCHDASYLSFMNEWTTGVDMEVSRSVTALKQAEGALARARRSGRSVPEAETLLREARETLALVQKARGVHNPSATDALLGAARRKAEEAGTRMNRP